MKIRTSSQVLTAITRIKRKRAERQRLRDDVAVLDEELEDARLALLKLRWKEMSNGYHHAKPVT